MDLPAYEDLLNLVDGDVLEHLLDDEEVEDAFGMPEAGLKVGGWPTLLQGELGWADDGDAEVAFVIQVDSQDGPNVWADGVLLLGRVAGTSPFEPDGWRATVQLL